MYAVYLIYLIIEIDGCIFWVENELGLANYPKLRLPYMMPLEPTNGPAKSLSEQSSTTYVK